MFMGGRVGGLAWLKDHETGRSRGRIKDKGYFIGDTIKTKTKLWNVVDEHETDMGNVVYIVKELEMEA